MLKDITDWLFGSRRSRFADELSAINADTSTHLCATDGFELCRDEFVRRHRSLAYIEKFSPSIGIDSTSPSGKHYGITFECIFTDFPPPRPGFTTFRYSTDVHLWAPSTVFEAGIFELSILVFARGVPPKGEDIAHLIRTVSAGMLQSLDGLRLVAACYHHFHAEAEKLLHRGVSPDASHPNGYTPLMAAADRCDVECVKLLLRYGANPTLAWSGHTPAFICRYSNYDERYPEPLTAEQVEILALLEPREI